jgi:uncharacterized membrane protein
MSTNQILLLLILAVLFAIALLLFVPLRRDPSATGSLSGYQLFGPGVRDDERYWLAGGFFYSNLDDPALFVPNRWGIGITLNLAHPMARRIALAFLLGLLLLPLLLALLVPGIGATGSGCHPFSGCRLTP